MAIEQILLPTDFSELSEHAAFFARVTAQRCRATVHVLHIAEPVELALSVPEIGVLIRKVPPDEGELNGALEQFVQHGFSGSGVEVKSELADGKPERSILDYARSANIDLIVMALPQKGKARSLVSPSLGQKVWKHAPCPVLLISPPHQETPPLSWKWNAKAIGEVHTKELSEVIPSGAAFPFESPEARTGRERSVR